MYNVVLFFHLLAALLFFAGIVVAGAAFETARRQERASDIATLLGMARVGALLAVLGGVALPLLGLWLVGLGHWGYGSGWVDWALGLYVVAMALGGFGGQRPKHARKLAVALGAKGLPADGELRALLNDRAARAANYASLALVLAILVLMVFKP